MNVVSRCAAISAGLKKYFTGQPCKNGHIAERYTNSGVCIKCSFVPSNARKSRLKAGELYFDGKPCIHGHGTKRYVNGLYCVECLRLKRIKIKERKNSK